MITKIILEAIVYTLLYSAFMLLLFKFQGAQRQLYNYPPAIKECAIKRGITTQEELDSNAKKNKLPGLLVMLLLSIVITCAFNKSSADTDSQPRKSSYFFVSIIIGLSIFPCPCEPHRCSHSPLFPIFSWADAFHFPECPTEVVRISHAHSITDLIHCHIGES